MSTSHTQGKDAAMSSSSSSSTTSPSSAADASVELELSDMLAPLSREQLELLVVRFVSAHPEYVANLLALTHKPVDRAEISNAVAYAINLSSRPGGTPSEVIGEIESWIEKANSYMKARNARNASAVLDQITAPMVTYFVQVRGVPGVALRDDADGGEGDDAERESVQSFWTQLENAWQCVFDQCEIAPEVAPLVPAPTAPGAPPQPRKRTVTRNQLTSNELQLFAKKMEGWRAQVTSFQGPVLSDAIRAIRRRLQQSIASSSSTSTVSASESSSSSTSSAPASKKRSAPSDASTGSLPATKVSKKNTPSS